MNLMDQIKSLFQEGDYKKSLVLIQKALVQGRGDADLFYMLGTVLFDKGDFLRAIKAFKKALTYDSNHIDSCIGLSILYNDLGKYELGQKIFEKAEKLRAQKKSSSFQAKAPKAKVTPKSSSIPDLFEELENQLVKESHYNLASEIKRQAEHYKRINYEADVRRYGSVFEPR